MERFKVTRLVGILGIFANCFLFIIKIIVGLLFKSQSMIADGFNSITDVFASLMTSIGNKIASSDSDEDHNFGHGKAEYIFSMFISISILIISIKLLFDSIKSLFLANKIVFSYSLVIVCLITIIVKLSLYLYTRSLLKKENNILIKSSMLDHRNDIFLTSGVFLSIILSNFGFYFLDSIVGILISMWFMLTGIKLFRESYNVLMDVSLDNETCSKIIKMLLKDKKIIKVSDLHSIAIGYKFVVILTIHVKGDLKTSVSHEIANRAENKIKENFENIKEVFIHIHPV